MNEPTKLKKYLLLGSSATLFIFLIWFLLNYCWLTISSNTAELSSIELSESGKNDVRSIGLNGNSKKLFLKRKAYIIKVSEGDKLSVYKKSLGFLWFNSLKAELAPQKSSIFLGKSNLQCAKQIGGEVLFSSCAPAGSGNIVTSSKRGLVDLSGKSISDSEDIVYPVSGILKYYAEGFLSASQNQSILTVSTRETKNNTSVDISNFNGQLRQEYIATSPDTEGFAVLDSGSNEIIYFNNISDNKPKRIKIPVDKIDINFDLSLSINKNNIYLMSFEDDIHAEEEEQKKQPVLLVWEATEGTPKSEIVLPRSWQSSKFAHGVGGKTAVIAYNSSSNNSEIYVVGGSAKLTLLEAITGGPQDICWKNDNTFYYLADAGQSIYKYSFGNNSSYLVYGGLLAEKFISDIDCSSGELYFSFDRTEDNGRAAGEELGYFHYKIIDKDFSGVRPESTVPIYAPVGGRVVRGDITQSGFEIRLEPDTTSSSIPPRDEARAAIVGELEDNGVRTEDLNFVYRF